MSLADLPDEAGPLPEAGVLLPLAAAVVLGTWCGKKVLAYLSEDRFRLLYRLVLSVLALRLIAGPLI